MTAVNTLLRDPPFRHDHVGSFLRPKAVVEARDARDAGKLSDSELRAIEDEAVRKHVKSLQDAGVRTITDGELRRRYFHIDFLKALDGVSLFSNSLEQEQGHKPPTLKVTSKLQRPKQGVEVANFCFLKALVPADKINHIKITIPSPTTLMRGGRDGVDEEAYPRLEDFHDDLAAAYREEIKALHDEGCRYVQLDNTDSAYLTDPGFRADMKVKGRDPDAELAAQVKLINSCIANKPADLCVATHLCKGNFKSTFFAKGSEEGYLPIANHFFRDLNVDAFFLEWEDADRSGKDFTALQYLPPHKTVVLGLVSSKFATLENKEALAARIREAAKVVPRGLEQLAISPQCGFSSTIHGNSITESDQYLKLQLCRDVAESVWGGK